MHSNSKERGMIFNAEMVRAILSGQKTQTRRIMKSQPYQSKSRKGDYWFSCNKMQSMVHVSDFIPGNSAIPDAHEFFSKCCPFGAIGDRIWVRETWMPDAPRDGTWPSVEFYGCKGAPLSMIPTRFKKPEHCIHRASWCGERMIGWKPSIHMPRWASRILLEITNVRVERLNDISEQDAIAEGIDTDWLAESQDNYDCIADHNMTGRLTAKGHFSYLWQSIYGDDKSKCWEKNPWVWCISFRRLE